MIRLHIWTIRTNVQIGLSSFHCSQTIAIRIKSKQYQNGCIQTHAKQWIISFRFIVFSSVYKLCVAWSILYKPYAQQKEIIRIRADGTNFNFPPLHKIVLNSKQIPQIVSAYVRRAHCTTHGIEMLRMECVTNLLCSSSLQWSNQCWLYYEKQHICTPSEDKCIYGAASILLIRLHWLMTYIRFLLKCLFYSRRESTFNFYLYPTHILSQSHPARVYFFEIVCFDKYQAFAYLFSFLVTL